MGFFLFMYVRKLGQERLVDFLNNFEEIYRIYDEIANEVNQNSILIFKRQKNMVEFFVELPDQFDDMYEEIET